MKNAISDAFRKGLGDFGEFSDNISMLQALSWQVPRHRVVAEIRDLLKVVQSKSICTG